MDRSSYSKGPSHHIIRDAPNNFVLNEDPFAIELDRLDVFDNANHIPLISDVVESKKSLFEYSQLMRKLMQLDKFSVNGIVSPVKKKKNKSKSQKIRKHNIGDDEEDMIGIDDENGNDEVLNNNDEEGKADEEAEDEEVPVDELEEENDYMDSYFDNGEDFID